MGRGQGMLLNREFRPCSLLIPGRVFEGMIARFNF